MGRIEADIALKSWLFGFRPCSALFGTGAVHPIDEYRRGPTYSAFIVVGKVLRRLLLVTPSVHEL